MYFGLIARDIAIAGIVEPCGNAMAPPQLAADAPVLDVVEPLEVGGLPVVGHEADATGFDRIDRGPGDRMQPARTGLSIVACLARSEGRRVGKECFSTWRPRWAPYTYKKKNTMTKK